MALSLSKKELPLLLGLSFYNDILKRNNTKIIFNKNFDYFYAKNFIIKFIN